MVDALGVGRTSAPVVRGWFFHPALVVHLSMNWHRIRAHLLWIAVLAVLWGALAPSLSSWIGSAQGKTWIEVCTSTGTKLIALETDDVPAKSSVHTGDHCPYCRIQQDLPAIAHAPGVLVLADGSVRRVLQPQEVTQPLPAAVWPAHRSRAPPSFS